MEHLQIIEEINNEDYVTMDVYTKSFRTTSSAKSNDKYGSLFWLLDRTKTAMGCGC
ncbi:MAG: hypothetical protein ACLRQF_20320 [Thomasclavelia ramosa]